MQYCEENQSLHCKLCCDVKHCTCKKKFTHIKGHLYQHEGNVEGVAIGFHTIPIIHEPNALIVSGNINWPLWCCEPLTRIEARTPVRLHNIYCYIMYKCRRDEDVVSIALWQQREGGEEELAVMKRAAGFFWRCINTN